MTMEPNYESAVYTTSDPIENLRIRVTLQRGDWSSNDRDLLNKKSSNSTDDKKVEKQILILKWQEKVMSRKEVAHYSSNDFKGDTSLDNERRKKALELKKTLFNEEGDEVLNRSRIFTYTAYDDFTGQYVHQQCGLTTLDKDKLKEYDGEYMEEKKSANTNSELRNRGSDQVVNFDPETNKWRQLPNYKTFIICVEFSNRKMIEINEYILCVIHENLDVPGQIIIRPDFNGINSQIVFNEEFDDLKEKTTPWQTSHLRDNTIRDGNELFSVPNSITAYRLTTTSPNDYYEYFIENVSKSLDSHGKLVQTENRWLEERKNQRRHLLMRSSQFGRKVDVEEEMMKLINDIPENHMRMVVNGNIICGRNFDDNPLFVRFLLRLPKNWLFRTPTQPVLDEDENPNKMYGDRGECLIGYTNIVHMAKGQHSQRNRIWYFSHPFEFDLCPPHNMHDRINDDNHCSSNLQFNDWPRFYVEVGAKDNWERYKNVGYGFSYLPTATGSIYTTIDCWRLRGNDSRVNELRRFFIGGNEEIANMEYVGVPESLMEQQHRLINEGKRWSSLNKHQKRRIDSLGKKHNILSRFALATQTTGDIVVRFNVGWQSRDLIRLTNTNNMAEPYTMDTFIKMHKIQQLTDRQHYNEHDTAENIQDVITSFQRAKDDLVEARRNLRETNK
ncbi:hypothetical protein SNEBB_004893 [Seison nebaliae]|nr:hypothetical protein SNEBB_004893 [Seison nebaliae]